VRLLVATTNPGKIREIRQILDGLDVELVTLADFPGVEAPEETGTTFEENARLKALYYGSATGVLTVAEDSGLAIDALDGAQGIESARFGGVGSTYPQKFAILFERLKDVPMADRTARFVCALVLAEAGRILFDARGTVEGEITEAPRGTGGFGYDPIFFYPPFNATLAESADRKTAVSHRGVAFRKLRDYLEAL
jgi:XTP/dITP diphosphohydrolase